MPLAEATATTEKQARPIVPFLKLPEKEGEKPYLQGSKCRKCGAVYLGSRMACSRCFEVENFETIRLSDRGEVHVFSVVHQSAPGIPVPYMAAIVDLPEGVSVRCNIEGVDLVNFKPEEIFGMPVEMYVEKVRQDREGNDVYAFKYRPVKK